MTEISRFLRNVWYMAAWSGEVGETMLARRMFDTPILLFRTSAGGLRARRKIAALLAAQEQ